MMALLDYILLENELQRLQTKCSRNKDLKNRIEPEIKELTESKKKLKEQELQLNGYKKVGNSWEKKF